jgi:drug/metabolite transporter (DMT)-like permease
VNTAIPFWLLSWGETRLQSGLASIIQAAVPIFNAALAFLFFRELRVTGLKLVGVAVGFVGVALLVGAQPHGKLLGALAVVGMAFCYGAGGLIASRHLRDVRAHVVALGTAAVAAVAVAPAGIVQAPSFVPSWKTFAAIAVLGVIGTALAYLLFFAIIASAGSGYASLVTYLVPPIALAYGAVFLDEHFGGTAFLALAIILAGVALGTGGWRVVLRRRALASEA